MGKWAPLASWLPHSGKGTSSAQPKLHMDECQAEDPRQSPEDRAFLPSSLPLVTYLLMFPNPVESLMTPCSAPAEQDLSVLRDYGGWCPQGVPASCEVWWVLDFVLFSAFSRGISPSSPKLTCWHVCSEPPDFFFLPLLFTLTGFSRSAFKGFVLKSCLRERA